MKGEKQRPWPRRICRLQLCAKHCDWRQRLKACRQDHPGCACFKPFRSDVEALLLQMPSLSRGGRCVERCLWHRTQRFEICASSCSRGSRNRTNGIRRPAFVVVQASGLSMLFLKSMVTFSGRLMKECGNIHEHR